MKNTKYITQMAMLFALALVFSIIESTIPPIGGGITGVKLGLSNIIIMFAIFTLNAKSAYTLCILKAFFVFISRGLIAFCLSLFGGLLSTTIILILIHFYKDNISITALSICGSITHNITQLCLAIFITKSKLTLFYLPVLIISGICMGSATGLIYKCLLPFLKRLNLK